MRQVAFTKMHGAGNDYVYIEGFSQTLPKDLERLAVELSHRRFGIGGDGVILIVPSQVADAPMSSSSDSKPLKSTQLMRLVLVRVPILLFHSRSVVMFKNFCTVVLCQTCPTCSMNVSVLLPPKVCPRCKTRRSAC